jgi:hypothetical protein
MDEQTLKTNDPPNKPSGYVDPLKDHGSPPELQNLWIGWNRQAKAHVGAQNAAIDRAWKRAKGAADEIAGWEAPLDEDKFIADHQGPWGPVYGPDGTSSYVSPHEQFLQTQKMRQEAAKSARDRAAEQEATAKRLAATPMLVDVILHLHGYKPGSTTNVTLLDDAGRGKVVISGLRALDNRESPTIALVPAGRQMGGATGNVYDFPFVADPGKLAMLISLALTEVTAQTQSKQTMQVRHVIVTAHSGGGFAVSDLIGASRRPDSAVRQPDEIYLFEATYATPANLDGWIKDHLGEKGSPDQYLRVIYRPDVITSEEGKQSSTKFGADGIMGFLKKNKVKLYHQDQALVHEITSPAHEDVPGKFCPLLLTDVTDKFASMATAKLRDLEL